MSGTLLLEGGPEPEPEGCPHGYKFRYACAKCNPAIAPKGQDADSATSKRDDDKQGQPPRRPGRPRKTT